MKRYVAVIASVVLGALIWQQQAVAQTVHYVDNLRTCADLVPCYATITDALNAAAPFDFIEVFPGVYRESVVFDSTKGNIVLQAHSRALRPVIAAPSGGNSAVAIDGTVPGVQVLKFIIEGGVVARGLLYSAVIQDNRVTGGIRLGSCGSSTIKDNSVFGGIDLGVSPSECVVDGNTVSDTGIRFAYSDYLSTFNVISHNVVVGAGISGVGASRSISNRVESNVVEGGSIKLSAIRSVSDTVIRRNIVRGGGIVLFEQYYSAVGSGNTITSNFVSGSAGDGILVDSTRFSGDTLIRNNTSTENAGCDINDSATSGVANNTWTGNRFVTKCGAATD